MLKIIVPVKQVPDIENVEFDREEGRIDRGSAESKPNPFDLNALEEALLLKEEVGGEIITVSMGPPYAESTLRKILARGADRAILLTDKSFAAADTLSTSMTLATTIKRIGDFDLIVCGEKTVDGDTGQVGPEIAELLDIPHVAFVSEVLERNDSGLKVSSDVWGKDYVKRLEFPALITVTKDVNEPRLPKLRDMLDAREAEIERWGFDDLSSLLERDRVGLKGSPTSVDEMEIAPEVEGKGEIFRDDPPEAASKLVRGLGDEGVLEADK
ncbi:hypothetical protein AKJ64_01515 [candidate division MSBL1 archaeon SCGC-AAA259E17]|uniref:Electron transfer flavoprotein alpha/beta-subunit N-terminal domain-containing protein n=1 Tax=candidate division MSBL1 archaeon SCGC-AAA259E17 TaxID=1698263 RepID=A0A133UFQ4_9EURY|nr:hypothetical protein AKJ64_01515 [candidate division MSBL1 archaeon SCGC-AAA259E17]